MDKIIFRISKNYLSVNIINKDTSLEDLNNTNIIDTKELMFSTDYIKENLELVSSFLNVIIIKKEVNRINVKDYSIISIILDIINYIPSITELYLKPEQPINYEIFLKLLDNHYLKKIDAYDIPPYLLERLDINKDLEIKVRSEILFISNFMNINDLNTYSEIYYKKYIIINDSFNENDYNEFLTFLSINKYLKVIEFLNININIYKYIMDNLIKHNKEHIKITLNGDSLVKNNSFKEINSYNRKLEEYYRENDINFKVNYSEEFKSKNLFKQLNLNFVKISLLGIISTVIIMMGINMYHNYNDSKNYNSIESDLNKILLDTNNNKNEKDIDYIEPDENDKTTMTTTTSVYNIKYDQVFEKLLTINDDTVGWLTVNNTNINYPVVQASDNDFYLKHDYYKNENRHGWVFMDYRNNKNDLDKNTIVYGHNLANQTMFGTLRYSLNSYWYKKTSNQIITYNSLKANMRWQIISIYTIPVTTDYLITSFGSDNEYLNFLNMIVSRSIYDFGQNYDVNDKILTLSTCSGSTKRLVIHAKLIKES
jgi:sortase B